MWEGQLPPLRLLWHLVLTTSATFGRRLCSAMYHSLVEQREKHGSLFSQTPISLGDGLNKKRLWHVYLGFLTKFPAHVHYCAQQKQSPRLYFSNYSSICVQSIDPLQNRSDPCCTGATRNIMGIQWPQLWLQFANLSSRDPSTAKCISCIFEYTVKYRSSAHSKFGDNSKKVGDGRLLGHKFDLYLYCVEW